MDIHKKCIFFKKEKTLMESKLFKLQCYDKNDCFFDYEILYTFTRNLDYSFDNFKPQYEQADLVGMPISKKCIKILNIRF